MRILFIVPYSPSLIRVRPYQLIRALARRGHQIQVAAVCHSKPEMENLSRMASQNVGVIAQRLPRWRPLWNCLRTIPSSMPLQAAFCWSPGLIRKLSPSLLQGAFDIVHVEHLRGALFGLDIRRLIGSGNGRRVSRKSAVPVVWDSVDCISRLFRQARTQSRSLKGRWMTRLELSRTRRFEGWLTSQFDHTLATSTIDCEALQMLSLGNDGSGPRREDRRHAPPISVLPNGVDLKYFAAGSRPRDRATVVFVGKMSYHANVTAAHHLVCDIMPRVWRRRSDVKVILVGENPPRSIVGLASFEKLRTNGRRGQRSEVDRMVEVTGTVADVRPYLQRATVSVAPILYGAGIQNKVLEAMACAAPVVASPIAVSSLSAEAGRDLLVAGDADEFASKVLELLEDGSRRETLGRAGRAYVEARHDWDRIATLLERVYRRSMQLGRSTATSVPVLTPFVGRPNDFPFEPDGCDGDPSRGC